MDYLQTDRDLPSGKATLLVFLPDAIKSRLVASIEHWICDRTACAPIARQQISFTNEALNRFYLGLQDRLPSETWQLVATFFTSGPCLATLWYGENAPHAVRAVKGHTHPARASESTVRGRFWCDNAGTNLVHSSDDSDEVARELDVLRSLAPDLFVGHLSTHQLTPFRDSGLPTPSHSGILTLCAVMATLLSSQGCSFPQLLLPVSGAARETMARAEAWLEQVRPSTSLAVAGAVESYLNGTANPAQFIGTLKNVAPVDPWQELILSCGVLSRPLWVEARGQLMPTASALS